MSESSHHDSQNVRRARSPEEIIEALKAATTKIKAATKRYLSKEHTNPYKRGHILLIRWAVHDIPQIDDEISTLTHLFKNQFGYRDQDVKIWDIPEASWPRSYQALQDEIIRFANEQIQEYESGIIYYAGHSGIESRYKGPVWYP